MQKRKITKSAAANIFRFAPLHRANPVVVESYLEFLACHYFEFSPKITYYESQPLGITYSYLGKIRRYTPDFLVTLDNGYQVYYELKYHEKTLSEEFRKKFEVLQNEFSERGQHLELITDKQIFRGEMEANLKLLYRYASNTNLDPQQEAIINYVAVEVASISILAEKADIGLNQMTAMLLNLAARKVITFNYHEKITPDTVFWSSHG